MTTTDRVDLATAVGAGLRVARRTSMAALVAAVLLVGSYFAMVLGHGALFGYSFFDEPAPTDGAETTIALLLLGYFTVALYGVTLWFGVMAVAARDGVASREALRRSVAVLWRDVWWAMPAMAGVLIATAFVVPGPFVIAPLATVAAIRVNRIRVRGGAVWSVVGRMLVASLAPTALVALLWLGAFVVRNAPSPSTWMAGVLCTVVSWLSLVTMAITAGAAVALLPEVELRPAAWAPPSPAGPWAPPGPFTPWTPSPYRPQPPRAPFPKARIAWIALLSAALFVLTIGGLAMMGDPGPLSRSGVVLDQNGLQVVSAVCPADRLLSVELRESGTLDAPGAVLWRVEGDVPLPQRLVVGRPIDGMTTTRTIGVVDDRTPLEVMVETSELGPSYPVEFTVGGLRPNEILSDQGTFRSFADFDAAARDAVPCGDPLDTSRDRSLSLAFTLVIGALLLAALVFVVIDVMGVRRRSRATMP